MSSKSETVKMTTLAAGPNGVFKPGTVHTVSAEQAAAWKQAGACVPYIGKAPAPETATQPPGETAGRKGKSSKPAGDEGKKTGGQEPPAGDGEKEGGEPKSEYPKALKGGWHELSDGSKVQGAEAAKEAQAALDKA